LHPGAAFNIDDPSITDGPPFSYDCLFLQRPQRP
jgi:hypothetical protein